MALALLPAVVLAAGAATRAEAAAILSRIIQKVEG